MSGSVQCFYYCTNTGNSNITLVKVDAVCWHRNKMSDTMIIGLKIFMVVRNINNIG